MTVLRGIDLGSCWDAPGVRGFFGKGYWPHRVPVLGPWLYNFEGSTFVAKTTTLNPQPGNMPLCGEADDFEPVEPFPKAIWYSMLANRTLNAINLSGPGARALFNAGLLVCSSKPFMISFMAVGKTREARKEEFAGFARLLNEAIRRITPESRMLMQTAPFALQVNLSCPNTGHDTGDLLADGETALDIFAAVPVPKIIKINIFAPVAAVKKISDHPECDALCFTNAPPFGSPLFGVAWEKQFPFGSPLATFGGGGYSAPSLLPLVCKYARELRMEGITKPFNLGGGIRHGRDIEWAVSTVPLEPKHDSVFFASAAIVRPWNIRSIIDAAHKYLG